MLEAINHTFSPPLAQCLHSSVSLRWAERPHAALPLPDWITGSRQEIIYCTKYTAWTHRADWSGHRQLPELRLGRCRCQLREGPPTTCRRRIATAGRLLLDRRRLPAAAGPQPPARNRCRLLLASTRLPGLSRLALAGSPRLARCTGPIPPARRDLPAPAGPHRLLPQCSLPPARPCRLAATGPQQGHWWRPGGGDRRGRG